MKTNRYVLAIVLGWIAIGLTSCGNYYRMTSRIHSDGSMYREVYAHGDSAFLKGNRNNSPFFFTISPGWELATLDSAITFNFWGEDQKLNVKVSRTLPGVGNPCFETLKGKGYMKPLVVPKESLEKHFKWFYTYYTYKAVYEELPDKGPVPLDKYMTKEQQLVWFKGDKQAFAGLNGMEMNNRLDDIQSKFWQWYNRSLFEFCYQTLKEFTALQQENNAAESLLSTNKETVYNKFFTNNSSAMEDISLKSVCQYFDEQGNTKLFMTLYKDHTTEMEAMFEKNSKVTDLFNYTIWFEVFLPGSVLTVNESGIQQKNDALVWKVDAFRILSGEYVLEAESRTVNYWAFIVTILLILLAGVVCRKLAN